MATAATPPRPTHRITLTEIILVWFVAGVFVIVEAHSHAFALLDESILNLARLSHWFTDPDIDSPPRDPSTVATQCLPSAGRYTVVMLPPGTAGPAPAPVPASGAASGTLWFHALERIRAAGPQVIAVDLDLSETGLAASDLVELMKPRPHESTLTALAVIPMPISGTDPADASRRRARNQWLRQLCEAGTRTGTPVAIAAPGVDPSKSFNSVVQYHGQRLVPESSGLPPRYPELGQVAKLLGDGLNPSNDIKGPGALCRFVAEAKGDERLPFVEESRGLLPGNGPALVAAFKYRERLFSTEWLNPYRVQRDIPILHVEKRADIELPDDAARACLAGRLVFVGQAPPGNGADSFPTLVSSRTPGLVVHAMVTRSSDSGLKSALSLSALLDFIVGYVLTALGKRISLPHWLNSESFTQRMGARLGRLLAPVLVVAVVMLAAALAVTLGYFLNPLVVIMGMWFHTLLESFIHDDSGAHAAPASANATAATATPTTGPRWQQALRRQVDRAFGRPRMAASGPLRTADRVLYWGSICTVVLVIVYATAIVASRIAITPG